jgi:signal transduction histidine kinase
VARDSIEEALAWPRRFWERAKGLRWREWARWVQRPMAATAERRGVGLSAKLLLLTIVFVMLAEVLIFVPSVANFRISWLTDRVTAAQLAALAAEAVPGGVVPDGLRTELLRTAQVRAVAIKRSNERRLVLPPDGGSQVDETFDFRASARPTGLWNGLTLRLKLIWEALSVFWGPEGRTIRVIGEPRMNPGDFIEVVLPEAPLRAAMVRYGLNVMGLSVIISVITAALVYFALNGLFVQPMMRMARNMLSFSQNPADASRIILPTERKDEIGTAERELAHMQSELTQTLQQKNRLAALGLAVSKISHDLRNMLASAQLLSDRLAMMSEPSVKALAPRLIASLDRAITLCDSTLRFGRAEEAPPRRELFMLHPLVKDVGDSLSLPREGTIDWTVGIGDALQVDADRDHMFRILSNLCRNALQALEQQEAVKGHIEVTAKRDGRTVTIAVTDDGPGVPEKARAHLFQAFQGSARKGGTGLGLAVAQELITAHGGMIRLRETQKGASFEITISDRDT